MFSKAEKKAKCKNLLLLLIFKRRKYECAETMHAIGLEPNKMATDLTVTLQPRHTQLQSYYHQGHLNPIHSKAAA